MCEGSSVEAEAHTSRVHNRIGDPPSVTTQTQPFRDVNAQVCRCVLTQCMYQIVLLRASGGQTLRCGLRAPPMPVETVYVSAVVLKPMPMAATATSALGNHPAIRISPSYSHHSRQHAPTVGSASFRYGHQPCRHCVVLHPCRQDYGYY